MLKGKQLGSSSGFLCYARADWALVGRFRRLLTPRLQGIVDSHLSLWWDDDIGTGQHWDREIRNAISESAFSLLLISPAFLASEYIRTVEIPAIVTTPVMPIFPVGLQRVDF